MSELIEAQNNVKDLLEEDIPSEDDEINEYEELDVKYENEICDEETLKKSMILKKKIILKLIVITDKTEKAKCEIDLTPKEREELEDLILLDESGSDDGILVKTETKYEIITDQNFSSPPIRDKTSPFFIGKNQHHIPVKLYQEYLEGGWNPTEVLYKLCCQCAWTGPEFRFIRFPKSGGIWCSVSVNNYEFMSLTKAKLENKSKNNAKNLASSKFLKFIGFKFSYESRKETSELFIPWEKRYSQYNSEALAREDMKREDFKSFDWETTTEDSSSHEHRRSSHSESKRSSDQQSSDHGSSDHRSSDHRSSDHGSSDHRSDSHEWRREIPKRKRSFDEESMRREFRRFRINEGRFRSPESNHRKCLSSPIHSRQDQRS